MTRQHMNRIALALRAFRASDGAGLTDDQYGGLIDQLALACSEFHPAFDYARFEDACKNVVPAH